MIPSLGRYRERASAIGLGHLYVREIEPSEADDFTDLGWLEKSNVPNDSVDAPPITDERGVVIDAPMKGRIVTASSVLRQVGADEIAFIRGAGEKVYAIRYFGKTAHHDTAPFLYFCFDRCRINPSLSRAFETGQGGIPVAWLAMKDDSLGYDVPEYYAVGVNRELAIETLRLFVDPRQGLNVGAERLLDVSGYRRNAQISADYASVWQSSGSLRFLRFDGSNDYATFGNILNLTQGMMIEMWLRPKAADATSIPVLCKKDAFDSVHDGYEVFRYSDNKLYCTLGDGSNLVRAKTSTSVLQNVWVHFAVVITYGDAMQTYLNGTADGTEADISGLGAMTNTEALVLAKVASSYGQVDVGAVRIYSTSPSDTAAVIARHFAAERAFYGV